MSLHLASSSERAVALPGRRALLQIALLAPLVAPYRARAAGAQSTAMDPILHLEQRTACGDEGGQVRAILGTLQRLVFDH